jgi:hypothetical protein
VVGALLTIGTAWLGWIRFVREGESPRMFALQRSGFFRDQSGTLWQWVNRESWGWRFTSMVDLEGSSGKGVAQSNIESELIMRRSGKKPVVPAEWGIMQRTAREAVSNYALLEVLEVGWPWTFARCTCADFRAGLRMCGPRVLEGLDIDGGNERPWFVPASGGFGAGRSVAPTRVMWWPLAATTLFFGGISLATIVSPKGFRYFRAQRRRRHLLCPHCGYPRSQSQSAPPVCPECGRI